MWSWWLLQACQSLSSPGTQEEATTCDRIGEQKYIFQFSQTTV